MSSEVYLTDSERREAARQFFYKWQNRGREDEDDRSYWIDFLQNVMGVENVTDRMEFQKKVVGPDGNTKRIDAYIPETKVLLKAHTANDKAVMQAYGFNIREMTEESCVAALMKMYQEIVEQNGK